MKPPFPSFQRSVALMTSAVLLAGCATVPPNGGGSQPGAAADRDPCNVTSTALVGAGIGLLIGVLAGGKGAAVKGAAVGGALGAAACLVVNVQSRQTKTAEQVDRELVQRRGALDRNPSVVSYQPQLSSSVQRGQPVQINTVSEIANGSAQPVRTVREELAVFMPDGTPINMVTKPAVNNGAGRFENSFDLKFPANVSQGSYSVKTKLYVNDQLAATRDLRTQVVWDGNQATVLAGL